MRKDDHMRFLNVDVLGLVGAIAVGMLLGANCAHAVGL